MATKNSSRGLDTPAWPEPLEPAPGAGNIEDPFAAVGYRPERLPYCVLCRPPSPETRRPTSSRASPQRRCRPRRQRLAWRRGNLIGRGTFGSVYSALLLPGGAMAAVKELSVFDTVVVANKEPAARAEEQVEQVRREVEILRGLEHPSIVKYLGFDDTLETRPDEPPRLLIFMQLMTTSLSAVVEDFGGALGARTTVRYTAQITDGLAYLHAQGVVHRDLKPQNCLLDRDGNVKLSDFGSATRLAVQQQQQQQQQQKERATTTGICGTPAFIAPEVLQGKPYDARADIWSLGCTVINLWSGRQPWEEKRFSSAIDLMRFVALATTEVPQVPPPEEQGSSAKGIDSDGNGDDATTGNMATRQQDAARQTLSAVIRTSCQRDPNQRPAASELLEMLMAGGAAGNSWPCCEEHGSGDDSLLGPGWSSEGTLDQLDNVLAKLQASSGLEELTMAQPAVSPPPSRLLLSPASPSSPSASSSEEDNDAFDTHRKYIALINPFARDGEYSNAAGQAVARKQARRPSRTLPSTSAARQWIAHDTGRANGESDRSSSNHRHGGGSDFYEADTPTCITSEVGVLDAAATMLADGTISAVEYDELLRGHQIFESQPAEAGAVSRGERGGRGTATLGETTNQAVQEHAKKLWQDGSLSQDEYLEIVARDRCYSATSV